MPARRPELPVVGVDSTTPFRRQRPVKRRCRPRPGNNGGGVEAAAAAVELGRVMRVEQTRVMSPDSCWQEQPRKVPRSSSRSLGEALSTLLYQPYECRDDSSSSSDEEQMIMTEDGKRPADGASVVEEPPASSGRGGVQEAAEEKWQAVSVSSEASAGADAAVSPVAPRMVSVSVEAGPPAASSAAPAVAAPEELETEDEERRLCSVPHVSSVQIVACERTFTSSEAQTDLDSREQRRRQRRERRQQRLLSRANPPAAAAAPAAADAGPPMDRLLPDLLLNSYLQQPPPYSTLPIRTIAGPPPPPPQGLLLPAAALGSPPPPPLVHQPLAMRLSFPITPSSRRCRVGSGRASHLSEEPKSCCGLVLTQAASIRWFIVLIAFVGVCSSVVGTGLGAMRATGRDHLSISLLMIAVGIALVLVSGVGWRLTAHDAPSCRAMLGFGGHGSRCGGVGDGEGAEANRRFVPRLPPSYGRPHHPYAAMIYPEFQYRPPPPSYQASMQEYRLRLLLLDRGATQQQPQQPPPAADPVAAVSPPPTYRSNVGSMLRAPMLFRRDNNQSARAGDASVCSSRPPSYRSRAGSTRPASVATMADANASVSLVPSASPSVSVICVGNNPKFAASSGPTHIDIDSEKTSLNEEQGQLVTIVQTGHEISSETGVTTVTVSGLLSNDDCGPHQLLFTPASPDGEMEILAHL